MSFYGLRKNSRYTLSKDILAEGIDGNARVTRRRPRGFFDSGGKISGMLGSSNYNLPARIRREAVGQAVRVTYAAPRGTKHALKSNFGRARAPITVPASKLVATAKAAHNVISAVQRLPVEKRVVALRQMLENTRPGLATQVGTMTASLEKQGQHPTQALRTALTVALTNSDATKLGFTKTSTALGAVEVKPVRIMPAGFKDLASLVSVPLAPPPKPTAPPWQMVPTIDVNGALFPADPKAKQYYGTTWLIQSPEPFAPEQMHQFAVAASLAGKALRAQKDEYLGPDVTIGEWPLLAQLFPVSAHHISFPLRMLEPWKWRPLAKFSAPQIDKTTDLGLYVWVTFKGNKNSLNWTSMKDYAGRSNGNFTHNAEYRPYDWKKEDVEQILVSIQPFQTTVRVAWYNQIVAKVVELPAQIQEFACSAGAIAATAAGGTTGGLIAGATGALCRPPAGTPSPVPDKPTPQPPSSISTTTWAILGLAVAALGYSALKR